MELRLKNVTSYNKNNFTNLDLAKKINILYGQNGCGKSTISNFFYNTNHKDFKECECTLLNDYRPIVYNSKFIEDNFYNAKEQKGVFTLSKKNADIEKDLAIKETLRQDFKNKYRDKRDAASKLKEEQNNKEEDCIEAIWKKTESIRNSELKNIMRGPLGSKKAFFAQLQKTLLLPTTSLEQLSKEYSELIKHKNKKIPLISVLLSFKVSEEDKQLLATPIIDSSNSYLSETIKRLQNLDWIKKGKELYLKDNICPFCQENTINDKFIAAIESIFDESYSKKTNQINAIKSAYELATKLIYKKITQEISACELISENEKEITISHIKILDEIASKNIELIISKFNNPSSIITLESDNSTEQKVNESINDYNEKIKNINIKVEKFKETEISFKSKIWIALRAFCTPELNAFSVYEKSFNDNHKKILGEMKEIENQGKDNAKKIKELRDQISNIDETIDSINLRLKSLGINSFSIKKHDENKDMYIISRSEKDENNDVYKSLSEGEKTLITFLYFLECCKGKTDKNDEDNRDNLIVIDDPISSLSQNYVYDIASVIHHDLIKKETTKKILILTHNLYFFHELIKLSPKSKGDKLFKRDYHLFRITKNEYSTITEIEKNSIQNEYQSLWQILKDAKEGNVNKIIIPNIMRNILEYYFAFVHRTDALQNELTKLSQDEQNSDFRAFYRYINRGSHSDSVNITDMGDIDPDKYIKQLKSIFSATGDEKHYLKMMDEIDEEIDEEIATA
ncbi:AAA family ATPase [Atlantibacter hermannii]|uniref:AAA family ATPase n=1 Tax=Atlantibacter hermannii TaxID=565 RepID=UPI00289E6D24|nr:AAA family ATPase [Atlantibacter hermannii]